MFKKEKMIFFSSSMLWYNHSYAQICLLVGTVSRVSDVAHWPLVHACILRMKVKIAIPGQISYLSIERQLN